MLHQTSTSIWHFFRILQDHCNNYERVHENIDPVACRKSLDFEFDSLIRKIMKSYYETRNISSSGCTYTEIIHLPLFAPSRVTLKNRFSGLVVFCDFFLELSFFSGAEPLDR
jgi:hypothetical protein